MRDHKTYTTIFDIQQPKTKPNQLKKNTSTTYNYSFNDTFILISFLFSLS